MSDYQEEGSQRNRSFVNSYADQDSFSSDAVSEDDKDGDFNAVSDQDDEFFFKPSTKRSKITSGSREQRARNSKAVRFSTRKRRTSDDEDDSEDHDFVATFKKNTFSAITSQRKHKVREDTDFVSSISIEDIAKNEDISEDEVVKMLNEKKKPQVDEIIGVTEDQETGERKYYVKFQREPTAHAVYLTEDELTDHPSGQSHLKEFLARESEEGLKDSIEIPNLKILGDLDENERPPMERIISYDDEKHLYLVKWQGIPYERASWVSEINDEKLLKSYKQRNSVNRGTAVSLNKVCKPYGTDPGCIPLPNYKNGNKLRSYQVEALNWLRAAYHTGQNAILADEMGLGKTVMCISLLIDIVQNCGVDGPFLIVAPLSTLPNWIREFENWSNIDAILFHGSQQDREVISEYELFFKPPRQNTPKFQVLLTNIETVQKSIDIIQKVKWHLVIIDEAHRLKNLNSKIYQMMFSLQMEHVLLMTGTPIQNNIDEIYALMHFIAPLKFPSLEEFKKEHGSISNAEDVSKLQATIRPYMLRRKKCDVEASIGVKEETIVEVELTRTQKFYYRLLIDKKTHELSTHKSHALAQDLNNLAMHLRKVCNHPYLFDGVEEEIKKPGEDPCEAMINASGKLVFVDKLLAKLRPKGNKVLIFSQMVQILNILEDFLNYRKYPYVRLDGSIVGEERQVAIDKFSDPNSDVFVFLLCTRAGGVGLNLTAADTVIIYDSDWNPQNDLQAQARCHRIGQTKDVKVYRLITRGTYEQDMFVRASIKLGLDQAILDSGQNSTTDMTPKEIETLIKRGAYYVFNEDEKAADEFVAEDVDQILEKHTKTLSKSVADRESVFSKASFVVDKDGEKIDLNDKNFWDRVIPENLRNQKEEEQPLPPRRSRSMTSYNETELEKATKQPEFSWNVKTRDILLKALLSLGFGRWDEILNRTHLKADIQKIQDGSTVLLFLISKNLTDAGDFLSEIVGVDEIELTKPQKKIKQASSFTSQNFLNILSQDSEEHATRLRQLHAINEWHDQGSKLVKFDLGDEAPEGWSNKLDQKLLKQVWTHGFGNWKPILKDESYAEFQTSDLNDRLIFITNALITMYSSDSDEENASITFPDLRPNEMRMLVNLLTDLGIPESLTSEGWVKYADIFEGIDDYQQLVKKIVECVRAIAYYDPSSPPNALRRWLNAILPHSDTIAASINQQQAIHIKENIDFVSRLRKYKRTVLPTITPSTEAPRVFVPSSWVVGDSDIKLINHVCQWQFGNLYDFILNEIPEQFDDQQKNTLSNNSKYYQKHIQHKRVKGDLSFYIEDYSLKDRIQDFIEQNGGWKDIPRIIDLPEGSIGVFNLPFSMGDIVIESTGKGDFFMYDDTFLCREGLSTTVRYGKTRYTCTVESPTKYVVKRGEKYVYEGETPTDAWHAADPDFDQNAEALFGITCNQIVALYDKECDAEMRKEKGFTSYVPPDIIRFTSSSATKR